MKIPSVTPAPSRLGDRRFRGLVAFFVGLSLMSLARAQSLPSPWQEQDIGTPSPAGSTSYSAGTYTISCGGSGAFGTAPDKFHFVYQAFTGDGTIVAKVNSVSDITQTAWEHGGIMFREDLATDSAFIALYETPAVATNNRGMNFEWRPSKGGSGVSVVPNVNVPPPQWLRLVRSGNTVTGAYSSDGTTWTTIGTPQTFASLKTTIYVGLAVASQYDTVATTAVISNVSVTNNLPSPWVTADLGAVTSTGSASYASGTWTVAGSGVGPWGTADSFRFVGQPIAGDGAITAHVTGIQDVAGTSWEHGGLMIRDSLDPSAAFYGVYETPATPAPGKGIIVETRTTNSGTAASSGADTTSITPYWLRLVRSGDLFTAYRSSNGTTWTAVGTPQTITMGANAYVGLVASSEVNGTNSTMTFDNVSFVPGPTVAVTAPPDSSTVSGNATVSATATPAAGATILGVQFKLDGSTNLGAEDTASPYSITWDTTTTSDATHVLSAVARDSAGNVTTSGGIFATVNNSGLPAPWSTQDIGTVGAAGSASLSGGTYTIAGSGIGPWGTADSFRFASQSFSGDFTVTTRVVSVQDVTGTSWEHGGLMARETLAPGAKFYGAYETPATPGKGIIVESRTATNGSAASAGAATGLLPPYWLRLTRNGDTFTALRSSDGVAWTAIGSQTITMATNIYVGFAVSSEVDGTLSTAVFDNFALTHGATGTYKTTFPRIGGILYNKAYEDTTFQAKIAKHDLAVLTLYKGWGGSTHGGLNVRQAVQQIKARNPSLLVGNYTIVESAYVDPANTAVVEINSALTNGTGPTGNGHSWTPNDWWARDTSGALVYAPGYGPADGKAFNSQMAVTNLTSFVTPDANGDRFPQFAGKWAFNSFFDPVPEFDFCFSDNAFWRPRYDVDWDRGTGSDSQSDNTVRANFRAGTAAYWAELNTLKPSLLIMGNVDGQTTLSAGYLREVEYQGKIGMALYESALGKSFSEEKFSGWYNMMTSYRTLLANTAAPHIVLVGAACTTDGKAAEPTIQSWYGGGASWAFARYALASVLMDDGYLELHPNSYTSLSPTWLDEYDLVGGPSGTSWLGAAIDPPPALTAPYQNGVFRRRFQNGMAIVNPRTNSDLTTRTAQTITIESGYKHFLGTQDSTTNNGAAVTTLTIPAGDGVLLIKSP